jgi:hypothetical protein
MIGTCAAYSTVLRSVWIPTRWLESAGGGSDAEAPRRLELEGERVCRRGEASGEEAGTAEEAEGHSRPVSEGGRHRKEVVMGRSRWNDLALAF